MERPSTLPYPLYTINSEMRMKSQRSWNSRYRFGTVQESLKSRPVTKSHLKQAT